MSVALPIRLPTGRNGRVLALGLTVLLVMLIWLGAVRPLVGWYTEEAETLAHRQAMAQRMAQLAATLPALREQAAATHAATSVGALLEGETDAIAAANLQVRLQAFAATEGTSLTSVEMLPTERPAGEPANSDRTVLLRLTLETSWAKLMALLDRIEAGPPLIVMDALRLESSRQSLRLADQPLQASLTVIGFRRLGATANASNP